MQHCSLSAHDLLESELGYLAHMQRCRCQGATAAFGISPSRVIQFAYAFHGRFDKGLFVLDDAVLVPEEVIERV